MNTDINDINAYYLANYSDISQPDNHESPGAVWLLRLRDAAAEIIENRDEYTDLDDAIHEAADQAVPIYTHNRWEVFTDLAAYNVADEGMCEGMDMTDKAGVLLCLVAEQTIRGLTDEYGHADE